MQSHPNIYVIFIFEMPGGLMFKGDLLPQIIKAYYLLTLTLIKSYSKPPEGDVVQGENSSRSSVWTMT